MSWNALLEFLGADTALGAWLFAFMWVCFALMFVAWAIRVAELENPVVPPELAQTAELPAEADLEWSPWEVLATRGGAI